MANEKNPFLLTPLRKGESKLTYVGMLIANTQEKKNKEVPFWVLNIFKI